MRKGLSIFVAASLLASTLSLNAQETKQSKEVQSVQKKIDKSTNINIQDKRKAMLKEAIETIQQTALALKALDDKNSKKAMDILSKVSGKIDLIVARDPSLHMLPVSIQEKTIDTLVNKQMIKSILYDATQALKDGKVQEARYLLKDLASEIVITTTSIPLATYPAEIKAIAPLIDKGKVDEAKVALQHALNSLVVTQQVIPLPILRASLLLQQAEVLVENAKRDKKQTKELDTLLKEASYQLEMAELLGYGTHKQFSDIYDQIDLIKSKIDNKNSGIGWFDKIKDKLKHLMK